MSKIKLFYVDCFQLMESKLCRFLRCEKGKGNEQLRMNNEKFMIDPIFIFFLYVLK
jgi:hypothetical protein